MNCSVCCGVCCSVCWSMCCSVSVLIHTRDMIYSWVALSCSVCYGVSLSINLYTYIDVYLSLYIYICIWICLQLCMYIYIYMFMYTCVYSYTYTYTCIFIYICTHIYLYIHICINSHRELFVLGDQNILFNRNVAVHRLFVIDVNDFRLSRKYYFYINTDMYYTHITPHKHVYIVHMFKCYGILTWLRMTNVFIFRRPRSFLETGFRPLCPSFAEFVPSSRTKPAIWISTRKPILSELGSILVDGFDTRLIRIGFSCGYTHIYTLFTVERSGGNNM